MNWIKRAADFEATKEEVITTLEDARTKIEEAAYALKRIQRTMRDLPYDYNIAGNMSAYVINYLEGGVDSIVDKLQKYIDQTAELEEGPEEESNEVPPVA